MAAAFVSLRVEVSVSVALYLQPCSYKQGYPLLFSALPAGVITGTTVSRCPMAKLECLAACSNLQTQTSVLRILL